MKGRDRNLTAVGSDAEIQHTEGCVCRRRGNTLVGGLVFSTLFFRKWVLFLESHFNVGLLKALRSPVVRNTQCLTGCFCIWPPASFCPVMLAAPLGGRTCSVLDLPAREGQASSLGYLTPVSCPRVPCALAVDLMF